MMRIILITLFILNPRAKFNETFVIHRLEEAAPSGTVIKIQKVVIADDIFPNKFVDYQGFIKNWGVDGTIPLVIAHSRSHGTRREGGTAFICRPQHEGLAVAWLSSRFPRRINNLIITHELGHALGAFHDTNHYKGATRSVMYPFLNGGIARRMTGRFFEKSRVEIAECLQGNYETVGVRSFPGAWEEG